MNPALDYSRERRPRLTIRFTLRRLLLLGIVLVFVGAFSIWVLFYASRPARQVGQLVISPPGRPPVTLTLWAAEPVVDLPFTTDSAWVRYGKNAWKLHGREFGSGIGPIAVSPDWTQAVAYSSFEGGKFPAVLIDLRTGAMQPVSRWTNYESQGWTLFKWQ